MNKMDDFIKDRLQQEAPAADGWNVPSDRLWENALPHLPKKKKRRPFFGFFLALVALTAVTYFGIQKFSETDLENTPNNTVQNSIVNHNPVSDNSTDNQLNEDESINDTEDATLPNQETGNEKLIETSTENNTEEKAASSAKAVKPVKSETAVVRMHETKPINVKLLTSEGQINNQGEKFENNQSSKTLFTVRTKDVDDKQVNAKSIIEEDFVEENKISMIAERRMGPVSTIRTKYPSMMNASLGSASIMNLKVAPIIPVKKLRTGLPKREVGVFYVLKPLAFLQGEINLNEESDKLKVQFSYINLGLSYTQWVKPRWSITTGISYSNLATDFDVDVDGKLTSSDINTFINQQFGEIANQSGPTSAGQDLAITIKPGFMLNPGDEVNISGNFNMNLDLVEIPLFINRHWYRKHFEYSAGLGASVDVVDLRQGVENLQLTRGSDLLSEPSEYQEERVIQFFGTGYVQGGAKYHITPNWNVGVIGRLAYVQPILSGLEVGLNYRWNK